MTIQEAITRINTLRPAGGISIGEQLRHLSELDGRIKAEIIDAHQGGAADDPLPYSEEDMGRALLVPFPYDELYVHWLDMRLHHALGEEAGYNRAALLYNTALLDFKKWYNRTHMPRGARVRIL